jgi:holliday junction DNA helicase RuvA
MFNSISGIISGKRFDLLFVDQGGLEWEISVPAIAIDDFGRVGDKTKVYTWLQHREDQMRLFGFPAEASRQAFLELIKVDGIGPRQAVKILSGISLQEFEKALASDDLASLEKAPGVGKKTAQKILLAMKGKVVSTSPDRGEAETSSGEIVRALAEMGYEAERAKRVVAKLETELSKKPELKNDAEAYEKELFRQALLGLSGGK